MLHAPTLKLYAVKEEPVPNKDVRIVLRDWAVFWQSKLHQTGRHVKLYGTFWNTPEGCVSILTELMSANSLQNLLDSCSTLPEGVIKKIAPTIISALQDIHSLSPQCYGSLTPSQILFKPDGSLKLSLGIAYRTCPQLAGQFFSNGVIQQSRSIGDRISMQDPVALTSPSPSITKIANNNGQPSLNEQIQKADDVFRLGFLILTCAVGSLDILQHQGLFFECIQVLLDQANKTESNSTNNKGQNPNSPPQLCCLLHSEQIINEIIIQKINLQQSQSQMSSNSSTQSQKSFLSLNDLLTPKRYSEEFLSFLCQALKFNWQKRATLQQLKAHPFLAQQDTPAAPSSSKSSKGLPLSIHELLKISSQWNRSEYQQPLPLEHQGISEQQLDRLCDAMLLVLPNCQKWFTATNYMEYTKHIKHLQKDSTYLRALAKDLGINAELVYDKITQVYQHIPFIQQLKQQQQIQGKGNNNNNSISNQQMQQKSDFINQQ